MLFRHLLLASSLLMSQGVHAALETSIDVTDRLLANYGPISMRPKVAEMQRGLAPSTCQTDPPPEDVRTQFWVDQYHPLNINGQTFAFDGYLRAWWSDARLAYGNNGTASGGCVKELDFKERERNQIWKPEFYWEGAKEIKLPSRLRGTGELLKVYPSGLVWWSQQVTIELNCPFAQGSNLDFLPFDTQTCTFTMGMYAETAAEVHLRWRANATAMANWNSEGNCLAEWFATSQEQEDQLQVYETASYSYAVASISFTRSPKMWLLTYLIPAVVLVIVSYLGFFIDPAVTPARVALGMLCLVVVMTNFVGVSNALPATRNSTWLTRFLLGSFMFNAVAMIEQIAVSYGLNARKWLEDQRNELRSSMPWKEELVKHKGRVVDVMKTFDVDNDGTVSKKEFRRGIGKFGLDVSELELNELFDRFDIDGAGTLDVDDIQGLFLKLDKEISDKQRQTKLAKAEAKAGLLDKVATPVPAVPVNRAVADGSRVQVEIMNDASNVAGAADRGEARAANAGGEVRFQCAASREAGGTVAQEASSRPRRHLVRALTFSALTEEQKKEEELSRYRHQLLSQMGSEMRLKYRTTARENLDHGAIWSAKVFYIFPMLVKLQSLDHIFRVVFPLAYVIYMIVAFQEVNFGRDHDRVLQSSVCYV